MKQRPFVMLDRDGTIIVERHYLCSPESVELLPNAVQGLRRLREMGLGLVVLTNQSAVGRGMLSEGGLRLVHGRMCELLEGQGVRLDGIYFCPHGPDEGCACRKPRTGMVEQAAAELGFDPKAGFLIGDKSCDLELGRRVGATTLLVRTGYGAEAEGHCRGLADYVVDDLLRAAEVIGVQAPSTAA